MLGRIYRYDELSNDGGESAIRPAIVFAKHIEMSELCNNSACFSAEIKGTSDICVTFEFYNNPQKESSERILRKRNSLLSNCRTTEKEKSRRAAALLTRLLEAAALIFRAAVSLRLHKPMTTCRDTVADGRLIYRVLLFIPQYP